MEHMTARQLAQACGGRLLLGDPETPVKHISLNSNIMEGNDLFVPLIGEKVDAHRFLLQAEENGASAVFTSEHDEAPRGAKAAWIRVEDTKKPSRPLGHTAGAALPFPS